MPRTAEQRKKEKDDLKKKLSSIYDEERKEREERKEWIEMYADVRNETLEINEKVREGKLTPADAVQNLKDFVEGWELEADEGQENE